ncbi:TPA: hypothetical protein DIS56_00615 [Candidatus Saccharibacteria bacterium]|nr:MAG: hypothetical protein A3F05_01055 [Candidatus Saccharibacteria bacterium RIFCSPHIGHO2_12_FULL_47_17]HCM51626.1 hypothetical protein [Candidatus Saccharibacteria bacterium]
MNKISGETFSQEIEKWLKSDGPKTLSSLIEVFGAKSFGVIILFLMIIPALPLPTAGVTHVFEIVVMLLALEMIGGLKTIWLPNRWQNMRLGKIMERRAIPMIARRISWFERRSSPRWRRVFELPLMSQLIGLLIFIFALAAFLAPPLTGLDTLPSMGVVVICLGLILEDSLFLFVGSFFGSLGVAIIIGLSTFVIKLLSELF